MVVARAQAFAHELTIEYLRANPETMRGGVNDIEVIVDKVADINLAFYSALSKNTKIDKSYPIG